MSRQGLLVRHRGLMNWANWGKVIPLSMIGIFSLVLIFAGYGGVETAMDPSQPDTVNPLLIQDGERTPVGNLIQPLLGLSIVFTLFSFISLVTIQLRR